MLGHFTTSQAHYSHQMAHIKLIAIRKSGTTYTLRKRARENTMAPNIYWVLRLTATNLEFIRACPPPKQMKKKWTNKRHIQGFDIPSFTFLK